MNVFTHPILLICKSFDRRPTRSYVDGLQLTVRPVWADIFNEDVIECHRITTVSVINHRRRFEYNGTRRGRHVRRRVPRVSAGVTKDGHGA